jgi:hypothetical protein
VKSVDFTRPWVPLGSDFCFLLGASEALLSVNVLLRGLNFFGLAELAFSTSTPGPALSVCDLSCTVGRLIETALKGVVDDEAAVLVAEPDSTLSCLMKSA